MQRVSAMRIIESLECRSCLLLVVAAISVVPANSVDGAEPSYPPELAGGTQIVTDTSDALLTATSQLQDGVEIAKTAPTVDFTYYPEQTYPGKPWSVWGDSLAAGGKYYSATQETADGYVYTISTRGDGTIWRFNTRTEKIDRIGNAAVGSQTYVTSLDVDPTGRFLYYVCGAHGGSQQDGTPIVQFDVKAGKKKVLAFLHPFYKEKYGYVPLGTFGSAISEKGDKLYVTWNGNRGGADSRGRLGFDTCALTVIHIPESERQR